VIAGGCACGAVRFEIAAGEPLLAGYCHCTRCQRRTGTAASAQAHITRDALRIVAGEELVATWLPETGFAKLFCARCGGALFSHSREGGRWSVRLGALDPGHGIRPSYRQRLESACAWEPVPDDGLERHAGPAPVNRPGAA
jgi:hypothetical protein